MTKEKSHYALCFFLGFGLILFLILPDVIQHHGAFVFTGDINQQGLPFIYHLHENIRSGNFFWNWYTGLGINQIGAYTYYNLFSPFFLITLLFPAKWLVYMMPGLMALKFGVGAVTAYAWLRQYLKTDLFAVSGALLYVYSTFTAYNLVFHFLDIIVLFPLLLLAMDQLMDENRRGFFALSVAMMAMLNYYFFLGQVIFCVLYFILRCACKRNKFTWKLFFSVALEAVLGVLIAGIALLPTAEILINSPRIAGDFSLKSLLLYDTGLQRYGKILQSMFVIPDFFNYSNFFFDYTQEYPYGGVGSSVALYLPLFSMTGVISYIKAKKKDWKSFLMYACLIIALIPALNNMFSAFSPNYYARWFYMPLLIMSFMTMEALDEEISFKPGIILSSAAIISLTIWLLSYNLFELHRWDYVNFNTDRFYAWAAIVVAVLSLAGVILILKMKKDKEFSSKVLALCCLGILCSSGFMVYYGLTSDPNKDQTIDRAMILKSHPIQLNDEQFVRGQIEKTLRNYSAMWGIHSIDSFHSVYGPSVTEFYTFTGITTDNNVVALDSTPAYSYEILPYTSLFSSKYFFGYPDYPFVWTDEQYESLFPGSHLDSQQSGYYIFENENYIPMGFTYDYSVTREQLEKAEPKDRAYLMLKALCIEENELLPCIPDELLEDLSYETYQKDCENRRKFTSVCTVIPDGMVSEITLPYENYVFYSIPYDKGFKAFDESGKELPIIKANIGFSAVKLPAGSHTVTFKYRPVTWNAAVICTVSGILLLAAYWIFTKKQKI